MSVWSTVCAICSNKVILDQVCGPSLVCVCVCVCVCVRVCVCCLFPRWTKSDLSCFSFSTWLHGVYCVYFTVCVNVCVCAWNTPLCNFPVGMHVHGGSKECCVSQCELLVKFWSSVTLHNCVSSWTISPSGITLWMLFISSRYCRVWHSKALLQMYHNSSNGRGKYGLNGTRLLGEKGCLALGQKYVLCLSRRWMQESDLRRLWNPSYKDWDLS